MMALKAVEALKAITALKVMAAVVPPTLVMGMVIAAAAVVMISVVIVAMILAAAAMVAVKVKVEGRGGAAVAMTVMMSDPEFPRRLCFQGSPLCPLRFVDWGTSVGCLGFREPEIPLMRRTQLRPPAPHSNRRIPIV